MARAAQLRRLLFLTSIAVLTCTSCLAQGQSDVRPGISLKRSLLDAQSDLTKAEGADCRKVKHLPESVDKCAYVKENCAKGTRRGPPGTAILLVNNTLDKFAEGMLMRRLNHILRGVVFLLCETCWAAPNHPIPGDIRGASLGDCNLWHRGCSLHGDWNL